VRSHCRRYVRPQRSNCCAVAVLITRHIQTRTLIVVDQDDSRFSLTVLKMGYAGCIQRSASAALFQARPSRRGGKVSFGHHEQQWAEVGWTVVYRLAVRRNSTGPRAGNPHANVGGAAAPTGLSANQFADPVRRPVIAGTLAAFIRSWVFAIARTRFATRGAALARHGCRGKARRHFNTLCEHRTAWARAPLHQHFRYWGGQPGWVIHPC